jgi:ribonucleoside-diphosphate reductase alpha chain
MNNYQQLIYKLNYSRFVEGRREDFGESVKRLHDEFKDKVIENTLKTQHREIILKELEEAIESFKNLNVMPSMRAFWTAGKPLRLSNISGYNCAYLPMDSPRSFMEHMYILMNGTGSGFSVERQYTSQLPTIPYLKEVSFTVKIPDSREGWATSYLLLIESLYRGEIPKIDYSDIRPAGTPLKTFGGRSSGHEPLRELINFTIEMFKIKAGKKLEPINVFDIACYIAQIVVAGGVRRSACIALADAEEDSMATAKQGEFWLNNGQRAMANISLVWDKDDIGGELFRQRFEQIKESGTGEPGIFIRPTHPRLFNNPSGMQYGTNPCGEVFLRPRSFCNLSEVVVRPDDDLDTLKDKAAQATLLGVIQSLYTKFPLLDGEWKRNCEEERLIGVSLTGLRDHPILKNVSKKQTRWLKELKVKVASTIGFLAMSFNINIPQSITCVKPSGTVSQLCGTSSGLHPGYSKYYIRRVRVSRSDPLAHLLLTYPINVNPEVGFTWDNARTLVFDFPQKAEEHTVVRSESSALDQLMYYSSTRAYTTHNSSCTVYVKPKEWSLVYDYIINEANNISGITFLPYSEAKYKLTPYEEISKEDYDKLKHNFEIDFSLLEKHEEKDNTQGARMYACAGGACEL